MMDGVSKWKAEKKEYFVTFSVSQEHRKSASREILRESSFTLPPAGLLNLFVFFSPFRF